MITIIDLKAKSSAEFLKEHSSIIQTGTAAGETYYFMPFWFRDLGDGKFELMTFESMPEALKEQIIAVREGKK